MITRVCRAKNTAGYDCVVTDWYRKLAKTEQFDIIKQYDTAKHWEAEAQRILDKVYRIAYKDLKWS